MACIYFLWIFSYYVWINVINFIFGLYFLNIDLLVVKMGMYRSTFVGKVTLPLIPNLSEKKNKKLWIIHVEAKYIFLKAHFMDTGPIQD